jgi:hypothetical protein
MVGAYVDTAVKPAQHLSGHDSTELEAVSPSTTISTTASDEKRAAARTGVCQTTSISPPPSVHQGDPYDTDIEAIMPQQSSDQLAYKHSAGGRPNPNCTVWPGQNHWKNKARAAKINNRSCQCMARLSKRTRLLVKLGIIFLVVAVAIGVGFGISKPLGADIWRPRE